MSVKISMLQLLGISFTLSMIVQYIAHIKIVLLFRDNNIVTWILASVVAFGSFLLVFYGLPLYVTVG